MLISLFDSGVLARRGEELRTEADKHPPPASGQRVVPQVAPAELADVLSMHQAWVESDGKVGERADLTNRSLLEVELHNVNLRHAFLRKARLVRADLSFADLQAACLVHATLDKVSLLHTKLRDAGLQGASLDGVTGLLPEQLGGASLFGAAVPEQITEALLEKTKAAARISQIARRLLVGMLLASACSALLLFNMTDLQIIANAPALPIRYVGKVMPTEGFFMLAPLLLLGLYVAFHVALLKQWEQLSELPAVYPDGQPLDRKARWTLMGLVRNRLRWLNEDRLPMSPLLRALLMLPAYWIVPATLMLFWGRYLTRLDLHASTYHAVLVAAAFVLAGVLPASQFSIFRTRRVGAARARPGISAAMRVAPGMCCGILLFLISVGIVYGAPHNERNFEPIRAGTARWAAEALWLVGYDPYARISEAEISEKPEGWSNQDDEITMVKGVRLDGRCFRHADAFAAFLVNARLSHSNFQEARLVAADLRGAVLRGANLRWAILDRARMAGVDLHSAELAKASLVQVEMRNANLAYAVLNEAVLSGARLVGSNFYAASLNGASMPGASLHRADLRASNLTDARMNGALLVEAQMWGAVLVRAQLRDAQLSGAMMAETDLRNADLRGARMQEVHLARAVLEGARLEDADLRGATGLTAEQLCTAAAWHEAQIDEGLRQRAESRCGVRP